MPFKRLNLTNMQYTALRLMTHRAVRKSLNPTSVMATPSMLAQRRTLINNESRGRSTDPGGAYSTSNKAEGTIKRWPHPVVESHGDYRAEAYLEAVIGGPLYAKQSKLPRLPIPSVHETLKRFLPTALPLAESEIEKQNLLDVCAKFAQESTKLQARLQAYCKGEMKESSWLQLWWNTAGYLQVRDPAVVNVSYFFHFSDDGTLPDPTDDMSLGVMRGAAILVAAAEFRKKVCSGTLPEESIGRKEPKTSLCSVAFKYMFNACRIPRRDQDSYRMYDPSLNTHCIVARKGHFFAVDFVDDHGDPLPLAVLERRLQRVIEHADEAEGSNDVPMLGWLTSCNRDSWADARDELIRAGGSKMERALARLESGALMLCLDDEEPISRKQCSNIFWTGSATSGQNRWFDKSIQIMCTNNGKAGLLGEHSMMDGMPMVGLADHITKMTYRNAEAKALAKAEKDTVVGDGGVKDLFRECTGDMNSSSSRVKECVHKAKGDFERLVGDHELNVQSFQGYGSNFIKKAGFSPDAYVQMAIQVATYRLFGKQVGTYEATQVRPFLHGRTETTRSVSLASASFVKRMGARASFLDANDADSRSEKLNLLRDAVSSHTKYIGNAAKGQGVDRHFLGLSMLLEKDEKLPALYDDPVFARSKRWRVSTSHLTHPKFDNWGFGEVVPDGVGVGYAVKANSCVFNLTARKEHDWTDRLSHYLEEALLEMQLLIEMDSGPTSKL